MPDPQMHLPVDVWAKVLGVLLAIATGLRYVVQLGALLQKLDTLTGEVAKLRGDLEEARLEIAELKAKL